MNLFLFVTPMRALALILFFVASALVYIFRRALAEKVDLIEGPVGKSLIRFTVPLLVGNLFQQFYSMVDAMILGRHAGPYAVGALGPSAQIFFLLISLILGFAIGSGVLIAQYFGAKDEQKLKQTIDTFYMVSFVGAMLITVFGWIYTPHLLRWLSVPAEIMPDAIVYLRITCLGVLFTFGYNGFSNVLRSVGDSITPLYFLMAATAINVVLDLLFIVVFGWGVAGAAWATLIAQMVSMILAMMYLSRRSETYLHFHWLHLEFDKDIFKRMMRVGLPSGLQQTLVSLSLLVLTSLVNSYGPNATAAYSVIMRIDGLIILPAFSFNMAVSTFVGQNIGAKQMDRVYLGVRRTVEIGLVVSITLAAIVAIFPQLLIGLFLNSDGEEAILIATQYFRLVGWFYPLAALLFIWNGAIRGTGRSFDAMIITLLATAIIRIPLALWLNNLMGLQGVWLAFVLSWAIGALLNYIYWQQKLWQKLSRRALI